MPIGLNNDVNNFGILNGTIGTDYRNLINSQRGDLRRLASPTTDVNTTSSSWLSTGIGFSYTPRIASSLLILNFNFSNAVSWQTGSTGYEQGYIRVYRDTSLVPLLNASPPVTSTSLYSNLYSRHGVGHQSSGYFLNVSNSNVLVTDNPSTINTIYYYLAFFVTGGGNGSFTIYVNNTTEKSNYTVMEYL